MGTLSNRFDSHFLYRQISQVRSRSPLILNLTNTVVMNITANALLAVGASPVMAHAKEELENLVSIAHGLLINVGTLDAAFLESAKLAVRCAKRSGLPIVLDPAGAGASSFRTEAVRALLTGGGVSVLRGNASEISAIVDSGVKTRGVDTSVSSLSALSAAQNLSLTYGVTVVISGEVDLVVNKEQVASIRGGHSIMSRVTGMGCTATSLVAAFSAVCDSTFDAAVCSMAIASKAGEIAKENSHGPGTFVPAFLDTLYSLDETQLQIDIEVMNAP